MSLIDYLLSSIVFWMAWVIIPFVMEICPAIFNFFILLKKKLFAKKYEPVRYFPQITLIIPVYNSEDTLRECIQSVCQSNYDSSLIHIMLVNNQSKDRSFEIFKECQQEFPELSMNWLNSKQGKSKALNLALFNSHGKYIIHIDSDGILHPDALKNMVTKFEQNENVHCVTGSIMTNPEKIKDTKGFFKKLVQKIEYCEYCQAFLAGRNFEAEFNSIYTLSGAFSAFRKSAILKTQLYNTDTVCEDTHVTFQIRDRLKKKVCICDTAYFFVDPIEDMNRLYTQRQRWQRGEMEVAHMFLGKNLKAGSGFVSNFVIRLLMYDHTFAFPRMIWYFALICLSFLNYPMKLVSASVILIYLFYTLTAFLYYFNILLFLKPYKEIKKYYRRNWYIIFLLPLFNFIVFWFRFAGIINAVKTEQTWKTRNLTEEKEAFFSVLQKDLFFFQQWLARIKHFVDKEADGSKYVSNIPEKQMGDRKDA